MRIQSQVIIPILTEEETEPGQPRVLLLWSHKDLGRLASGDPSDGSRAASQGSLRVLRMTPTADGGDHPEVSG